MKTLVVYLMAGAETPTLAEAAVEGGADVIELGFPFSDPLADGPTVRRAAERALAAGMRTGACLECLAALRERLPATPLVPMTYASLFEAWGWERLAHDAESAGATSLIVADLPAGQQPGLRRVQLVAPTSTDERIALAASETDGWLYLVTVAGTTGARGDLSPALAGLAERARAPRSRPAALRRLRDLDARARGRRRDARRTASSSARRRSTPRMAAPTRCARSSPRFEPGSTALSGPSGRPARRNARSAGTGR